MSFLAMQLSSAALAARVLWLCSDRQIGWLGQLSYQLAWCSLAIFTLMRMLRTP